MNVRLFVAGTVCAAFAVVLSADFAVAEQMTAQSKISGVTVYLDSALVTRTAEVKLPSGDHEIIFSSLVPDFDAASLRAGTGNNRIRITDVKVEKQFLDETASERVRKLQEELETLEDTRRELEHAKQALAERKQFLDSVRVFAGDQIPEDLVTKIPTQQQLAETLTFLKQNLAEYYRDTEVTDRDLRDLAKKISVVQRQLAEVSGSAQKMTRSIVVTAHAEKEETAAVSVSYLVRGASWLPTYDARADFNAQEVELALFGTINQRTGEEWVDVEMSLSTAQPAIGGRLPYVAPWFLKPREVYRNVAKRMAAPQASSLGMQYDAMKVEEMEEAIGAGAPEPQPSQAVEKGVAIVYTLARKVTVRSDGADHKFAVSAQKLKADFTYTSYPRVSRFAYLGSRVTNGPDQQLLSGPVNLFLEGDYVGTSSIDTIGPQEEFDLYLGADENVKVKRELIMKKADETLIGGIAAPTKRTTFTYKTTIENYKSKKIKMRLFEALPVSEDDRIKVKIGKLAPEPSQKDWESRKGVCLWEMQLDPKKKQEIECHFVVEHPREMAVDGL